MATPAAGAFRNLGSLIFGNDALDLQQQLVFRRLLAHLIEEHDPYPSVRELLEQDHLMHIGTRQAVGAMHIEHLDPAQRDRVPQPL
jgi:hypothetical protein